MQAFFFVVLNGFEKRFAFRKYWKKKVKNYVAHPGRDLARLFFLYFDTSPIFVI